MKKLAVFVEGQTEQIFVESLITEIAGARNVVFEKHDFRSVATLTQVPANLPHRHFVLVVDCQNDEKVKSSILDNLSRLEAQGYDLVLGLRDLYPIPLADLSTVTARIGYGIPANAIPVHVVVAVAEVEAWFLQESTHYQRIDANLLVGSFKAQFGFDPVVDSAEQVACASDLLHAIYASAGKAYRKKRRHVQRTVSALDFGELYLRLQVLLPSFREFVGHIEGFIS